MKPSLAGTYTMEALAVVSFCCIAAIFLVANHDLQVSKYNSSAMRAAKAASTLVSKFFETNPQGELSNDALGQEGFKPEEGVQVEIPMDNKSAANWQVQFWHEGGDRRYTVDKDGLSERPK